jgi:hypothetical protein
MAARVRGLHRAAKRLALRELRLAQAAGIPGRFALELLVRNPQRVLSSFASRRCGGTGFAVIR